MVSELATTTTTYQAEDRRWLRDVHGMTDTIGATLIGDLFPAATFPDGTVASGTRLGRVTASKLAGPFDPAATDGRNAPIGHLLDAISIGPGRRVAAAVLDHGAVLRTYLPNPTGLTAAQLTAVEGQLARIRYSDAA